MTSYSQEFKDSIISKMMPPMGKSPAELHQETGVPYQTLWNWKKKSLLGGKVLTGSSSCSSNWDDEAKLAVIIETALLNTAERNRYCREKGLYPHQIEQWRAAAVAGQSKSLSQTEREEFKALKSQNQRLKKELDRKEKALAEAAALMVLQKKCRAIWGESEDE